MLYHNIKRPSTGEHKTVPWGELPAGWKPVNGIQFEVEKPTPLGNVEKFEFNGKEYKTEAAMKAAITKAKNAEEAEEAEEAEDSE